MRDRRALERIVDDAMVLGVQSPQPATLTVPSELHDLADGNRKVTLDVVALRHVGDKPSRGARTLSEHAHLAGSGPMRAHDTLEQRRLAAAVGPDHRYELAGRQLQVDVAQGDDVTVGDGEVLHLDGGCGHDRPSTSSSTLCWSMPR